MEELKQKLLDICNQSGLPLEAVVFVTKDLWRDAEDAFRQFKEAQAIKNKEESEENE